MIAFLTNGGRRFLPLLAMGCVLSGLPSSAHADLLNSRLTDRATLALAVPSARGLTARVVFESQGENVSKKSHAEDRRSGPLAALALIMIVPPGTMPVVSDASPPPPPPPPPPTSTSTPPPSSGPPGGHPSGGPTPEPGTLFLALSGSSTVMLTWLRRRRTRK